MTYRREVCTEVYRIALYNIVKEIEKKTLSSFRLEIIILDVFVVTKVCLGFFFLIQRVYIFRQIFKNTKKNDRVVEVASRPIVCTKLS